LTLDPKRNTVAQVIESYASFRSALPAEKRKRFDELMNYLYEFIEAINAKDEPFAEETALLTLMLKQHIIIEDLKKQVAENTALRARIAELERKIVELVGRN
jgi:hypothetical protein